MNKELPDTLRTKSAEQAREEALAYLRQPAIDAENGRDEHDRGRAAEDRDRSATPSGSTTEVVIGGIASPGPASEPPLELVSNRPKNPRDSRVESVDLADPDAAIGRSSTNGESRWSFIAMSAVAAVLAAVLVVGQLGGRDSSTTVSVGAAGVVDAHSMLISAIWSAERDADDHPIINVTWASLGEGERVALTQEGSDCVHLGTGTETTGSISQASMTVGVFGASNLVLLRTAESSGCIQVQPDDILVWLGHIDAVTEGFPPPPRG